MEIWWLPQLTSSSVAVPLLQVGEQLFHGFQETSWGEPYKGTASVIDYSSHHYNLYGGCGWYSLSFFSNTSAGLTWWWDSFLFHERLEPLVTKTFSGQGCCIGCFKITIGQETAKRGSTHIYLCPITWQQPCLLLLTGSMISSTRRLILLPAGHYTKEVQTAQEAVIAGCSMGPLLYLLESVWFIWRQGPLTL